MAHSKLMFSNPHTGQMKEAPVGFSWTTLLWACFPPFMRGDMKWGFIILILAVITASASNLVFGFIYNKLYVKDLIASGFKATSVTGKQTSLEAVAGMLQMSIPVLDSDK